MDGFEFDNFSATSFVGRRSELDVLAREMTSIGPKTIGISGPPGSGKTSLALTFAKRYGSLFPGGIAHLHTMGGIALRDLARESRLSGKTSSLIIVDDILADWPRNIEKELQVLQEDYPQARMLLVGDDSRITLFSNLTLHLRNFGQDELEELAARTALRDIEGIDITSIFAKVNGNPEASAFISDLLSSKTYTPRQLLSYLASFKRSGIVDIHGKALSDTSTSLSTMTSDVTLVNDDLLRKAHADPSILYGLSSRKFEEFVADLLRRKGYGITLTPASQDGGVDIYAAKKDSLGSFLFYVECKRYAPDKPVGVQLVRQLHGVVNSDNATAGVIVTTSRFTRPAIAMQERNPHRLSLRDYLAIQRWLDDEFGRPSTQ